MPYDVPVEHVEQVIAAKAWFDEYYPRYPVTKTE
jgi:hypothetical protein